MMIRKRENDIVKRLNEFLMNGLCERTNLRSTIIHDSNDNLNVFQRLYMFLYKDNEYNDVIDMFCVVGSGFDNRLGCEL